MRFVRGLGRALVVVGATMLFFVAYELVGTAQVTEGHQRRLERAFDRALDENPVVGERPTPGPRLPSGAWARISIPSIGVDSIVVEGTTLDDLARGPGRYRSSVYPWQRGVVAIAGHRTGWGSPFIDLDRLRAGDEIVLQTLRGSFRYRVTSSRVVDPGDTWVLRGDPDSRAPFRLTLTTCTPKYTSLRRLIVWADLVAEGKA